MKKRIARHARKFYVTIISIAGAALLAVCVLFLFWLLIPYDNISFSPFQTDKQVYKQGDKIALSDEFCWDGTPFKVDRFFLSKTTKLSAGSVEFPFGYAIPAIAEQYAETGCSDTTVFVDVPRTLPPGEWAVVYETSWKPNPIRVVTISNISNTFKVLPEGGE